MARGVKGSSFGGVIKLTGASEYQRALNDIVGNLTLLSNELKLVETQYGQNDDSINGLISKNNILKNKLDQLTEKYNCTTVLKLHNTIVCSNEGEIYINETGNSALAKAGSGDVLTGMISGLVAQKMSEFEASKLGVYLHGRTGEIASSMLSEYSVLASDLLNYIPLAITDMLVKD